MTLTVGQTLWLVPASRWGKPHAVTVTKVGRKWAELGDRVTRVNAETLYQDGAALEELAGRLTQMARTYQSNGFPASTIDTASILVEAATAIRSILKAQPNAGPSADGGKGGKT